MSFSVSAGGGQFEWCGRGHSIIDMLDHVFAQRSNLASPSFLWMLRDMARFNRQSRADRKAGTLAGLSLGDYFESHKYCRRLARDYLIPMGGAIWSTPVDKMLEFPAENFVAFFDNHRLLHNERPVWRTVAGGSRNYVEKLTARFRGQLRLGAAVTAIERKPNSVVIRDSLGHHDEYDQVVVAAHSDQALAMLADATPQERAVLSSIRYRPNDVYLHRDARLMPRRKKAWASWNFLRANGCGTPGGDIAVTYWMNLLQGIDNDRPLFVSLNPPFEPEPELTFAKFACEHPQFDARAFDAQKALDVIQGVRRTWFCGAWTGYGFHEDGIRSGLDIAQLLGAEIPWRGPGVTFAQAAE